MGMNFHRSADGSYARRPTRGLDIARVMYPDGGGLEFCWLLRRALEPIGVQLIDRLFITGLLRDRPNASSAPSASTAAADNFTSSRRARRSYAPTRLRSGPASSATLPAPARCSPIAPEQHCATPNSAMCGRERRNSISKASPLRSRKARGGSTPSRHTVHGATTSPTGRTKPMCRASRAQWPRKSKRAMTRCISICRQIPEHMRDAFISSKVKWMDYFFRKLGSEAKTDMFGKTPYYALNQMTKMGVNTGAGLPVRCSGPAGRRSRASRLRQPFCRISYRALRRQWLDRRPQRGRGPRPAAGPGDRCAPEVQMLHAEAIKPLDAGRRGAVRSHSARFAADHVRL